MKPILFNGEMVRSILEDRKTNTRRLVKPQPKSSTILGVCTSSTYAKDVGKFGFGKTIDSRIEELIKPPYKVGDVLYVRETWRVGAWTDDGYIAVDYFADGYANKEFIEIKNEEAFEKYWKQSTDDAIKAGIESDDEDQYHWERGKGPTRWRPSLHMPKEAARIFLKVTGVRIERLNDMSEQDAIKEGIRSFTKDGSVYKFAPCDGWMPWSEMPRNPTKAFELLWNSTINKTDLGRYGWDSNPWVWVIEFEQCEKEVE